MGGKSKADNSAVVNQQNQQAADAKQKEADRQARLNQGLASIKDAFEGAAVKGTKDVPFDWSTFTANSPQTSRFKVDQTTGAASYNDPSNPDQYGLPTGYKVIQTTKAAPATASAGPTSAIAPVAGANTGAGTLTPTPRGGVPAAPTARGDVYGGTPAGTWAGGYGGNPQVGAPSWQGGRGATPIQPNERGILTDVMSGNSTGGNNPYGGVASDASGGTEWAIQGPDGKIYHPGDALNVSETYDTGQKSGGFDDAFYNKYKQSVLDYYMPQVDKQYKDSQKELTYRLARAGDLRSSAANTEVADLASQNDINLAGVRNQADTAAGDLKTQVASERAKATSQLYATEDPEVAANQALSAVSNISLQQPDLSPLSAIFNVASVGGANVLKGYQDQNKFDIYNNALNKDRSRNVGTA